MLYGLPILKPIFMAIARQPLIGPHGHQEADLLRSSAKQVAMFGADDPNVSELQKDVEAGRLIRIDVKRTLPESYILYGWPGADLEDISNTKRTLVEGWGSRSSAMKAARDKWHAYSQDLNMAEHDWPTLPVDGMKKAFYQATQKVADFIPESLERLFGIKRDLHTRLTRLNVEEFLEGTRSVLNARHFGSHTNIPHDLAVQLNHKVESGQIQCRKMDCSINGDMVIFGHPGQEKNMDDLAFILHNYHNHEAREHNTRGLTPQSEGQILGYSDQDIEYFHNRASFSNLHRFVLDHTHEIRRNIRIGLMKEMGSQWNRNP